MPKPLNNDRVEINSEYNIETISNLNGLVIESLGPITRNPDYNEALELFLRRLIKLQVPHIRIFVVSQALIQAFPEIEDREITLDQGYTNKIILDPETNIHELRLSIGRKQQDLHVNPDVTGGNNTKRILIYNRYISGPLWTSIANGNFNNDDYISQFSQPTTDYERFEESVDILIKSDSPMPDGAISPKKEIRSIEVYERDPKVKAWVLSIANGKCECCQKDAPFFKDNDKPYLEVHHLIPLSEDGSDTIANTIAVCPNCHMKFHYGQGRIALRDQYISIIEQRHN